GTLAVGQSRTAEVAANAVWAWTGIYLEKGVPYEFKAEGEWMDASIPADADGRVTRWSLPILFWVACRAILGNPPTWLQSGWRKITGNPRAAFRIARRQPRGRWFELVGVIGNNRIEVSRMAVRNEAFSIGTSATHRPRRSGYLYCYANDTWTAYGNNRGSLKLIVSRNALDAHSPTPGASHPPKWTDGGDPKEE
ncbi:MAG: hypothetical protein P4L98_13315, partial [Ancalomicrobiaceae bacterium]|nr:hypothetical protein [Ancalomicrobiaceae bacterium]